VAPVQKQKLHTGRVDLRRRSGPNGLKNGANSPNGSDFSAEQSPNQNTSAKAGKLHTVASNGSLVSMPQNIKKSKKKQGGISQNMQISVNVVEASAS